jgi:hypothetical protein
MKVARLALLAIACTLPLAASAQWMWLDQNGHKVFSDKAPPPDVPNNHILKAPKGQVLAPDPGATTTAAAAPAATGAASLPKPAGKDKALEERRKQLASAGAEKQKAEEAQVAALRADNCARARQSKATYQAGGRIARVDAKGERQYLDDAQIATEIKRMDEVIARDCAQ